MSELRRIDDGFLENLADAAFRTDRDLVVQNINQNADNAMQTGRISHIRSGGTARGISGSPSRQTKVQRELSRGMILRSETPETENNPDSGGEEF